MLGSLLLVTKVSAARN